jgi:ankyrin repeat protein
MLLVLFFIPLIGFYEKTPNSKAQDFLAKEDTSYGIPIKLVLHIFEQDKPIKTRKIFILIDEFHFNKENIQKVFLGLANKYPNPKELNIIIFSDKVMLQRAINSEQREFFIDFDNTPEGKASATKFYEKYEPHPKGYYRAYYYRYAEYEIFDYSPQKDDESMVRITWKSPPLSPEEEKSPTALHKAVREGDLVRINQIIQKKIAVNSKDEQDMTPLMWAAFQGKDEIVKILIENGAVVNSRGPYGMTPLFFSEFGEQLSVAKILISNGANVNAAIETGTTLLMIVAQKSNLEVVKYLIQSGANVNSKNYDGLTALMVADDDKDLIHSLIVAKADIELKDKLGWTALFHAINNDQPDKVELLLKNGADVNAKNKDELTPLAFAEQRQKSLNSSKIIALLKQAGAK